MTTPQTTPTIAPPVYTLIVGAGFAGMAAAPATMRSKVPPSVDGSPESLAAQGY